MRFVGDENYEKSLAYYDKIAYKVSETGNENN
jgi:hypothetical protein